MRFWDTSALVPLLIAEPSTGTCQSVYAEDPLVAIWTLTRVEIASAVRRRERAGELAARSGDAALQRAAEAAASWFVVDDLQSVRPIAEQILSEHALRAADALQLAAALYLTSGEPAGLGFVTRDERLATAARAEGFVVPDGLLHKRP